MTTFKAPSRSPIGVPSFARILVVDADLGYGELIRDVLSTVGYSLTLVSNGAEAVARLAGDPHELAILDAGEPISEGIDLARQVRRRQADIGLTFTAQRSLGVVETAAVYEAGADELIVKPFHPTVFAMRVTAVLRRVHHARSSGRERQEETSGVPAVLALDASARTALFMGRALSLTLTEFLLLQELLASGGAVVPSATLEVRLLGHVESGGGALRGHISALRQKLYDAGADRDLVRTVRGLGYYLDL